jgi:hypothetical protein
MPALFDDPMVQAGVAPFVVALLVAALLARVRLTGLVGLALVAALVTTLMLTTGIGFTPLSASRKVLLLVLLAPLVGLVLDVAGVRHKALAPLLACCWARPRPGSSRACWPRPTACKPGCWAAVWGCSWH